MSPLVLGLILVGAVAHASWNLAVKAAGAPSGVRFLWLTALPGAVLLAPVAVWQWLAQPPGEAVDWWLPIGVAAVSTVIHTAYFLSLQRGYRVGDVGLVYPLARGVGPLLAVVGAVLLLGERPGWLTLSGAVLIVAGVFVIGFAGGRAGAKRSQRGIVWGLAIGACIAAYTLWDAFAVIDLRIPAAVHLTLIGVGQSIALAPLALRDRPALIRELRAFWRPAVAVVVLSPISYLAVLVAFQLAPDASAVTMVAPGREVSVVLVGLAGWLIFKEPNPLQRLAGCVIIIGGVVLLALG